VSHSGVMDGEDGAVATASKEQRGHLWCGCSSRCRWSPQVKAAAPCGRLLAVEPREATPEDYAYILASLPTFWGERDLRALHHPMFLHEFGDTALVIHAPDGDVVAYLLGFVAPATAAGYVHLVGVRDSHRRRGLGRRLYAEFERRARLRGATSMKAITTPGNRTSIEFHRSLGMSATLVPDYAGLGSDRVVFHADLD
jgi:GNAT superfamily N-acetyltransferase